LTRIELIMHIKQKRPTMPVKCFLQCNINKCPPHIKSMQLLLSPILEYAATIWSPHTQRDINANENVQKRAAMFVTNYQIDMTES